MAETLRQKQSRFARMVPRLLDKATELGYEYTLGEALRPPLMVMLYSSPSLRARVLNAIGVAYTTISLEEAKFIEALEAIKTSGGSLSLHPDKLAIDLNLFKDGHYLSSTEAHRPLGEWWESIGGTWGGRFNDGNHYSLEHRGVK